MDEFDIYFRAHTDLNDKDIERIRAQAVPRTLRRNELLLIAVYLGISIKTLTRIRQAQLRR